jgi:CRISPR-associated protein Csd1
VILQALTRYYETLLEDERIAPRYYTVADVSFGLQLDREGNLIGILHLKIPTARGKKTVEIPQQMLVPEQKTKSGTKPPANFLCDNAAFMLGLDTKDKPEQALMYYQTAKETHFRLLEGVAGFAAEAIRQFFHKWSPENASTNMHIVPILKDLTRGGQFVFILADGTYAQNDSEIKEAWEKFNIENESSVRMQCLVTGAVDSPIAPTHPKIWNLDPSQIFGGSLVSFNDYAYESYGHEMRLKTGQCFNSPVSEYAAFAYTTALNQLLSDYPRRIPLDGDTVICWAETGEEQYQNAFVSLTNPREKTENDVSKTLRSIINGQMADLPNFKPETPFYVLCLSPNAARVSVRFFLRDTFGKIAENLVAHYKRLEIEMAPNESLYLSIDDLLEATVREKSDDKAASPLLAGATMRAILSGAPYPEMLYSSILIRIRADRKVNRARAATIKAYLTQNIAPKHPKYEEVLQVALNEQSELKPYVLGRLFSLLEQAQESALGLKNATITDRYFDSASATPKLAFPTLLKLNRHHLAKDESWGRRYEKQIGELLSKLEAEDDPHPARLTLEEQGLFILGYYHQKQARYTKKTDSEKEN